MQIFDNIKQTTILTILIDINRNVQKFKMWSENKHYIVFLYTRIIGQVQELF